jgi:hypothetical protein
MRRANMEASEKLARLSSAVMAVPVLALADTIGAFTSDKGFSEISSSTRMGYKRCIVPDYVQLPGASVPAE